MSNLHESYVHTPVSDFLAMEQTVEHKIGGLLDYGYSIAQVIKMLNIPAQEVMRIIRVNGFKEVSR